LTGLKKKLGREAFIAIMESACQNAHQTAVWSITLMGDSTAQVAQRAAFVEQSITEGLDARVLRITKESIR
jgi:hypothetical protein